MNIKFWNQPKNITLEKILNEKLRKGFKRVWLVAGMTKDTGIETVLESIEAARSMGTEVNLLIGVDRKNTSKDVLMKLLKLGCNLFLHINREDSKVETRIYVFENEDGESFVYQSGGKFSEGGLTTNYCLIQEITYMPEDIKAFENFKSILIQENENVFKKVEEEELKLLAEKGEVVARITERKIPRISEMYGTASIESIANDMYDESATPKLVDIQKNDFDIDVDIDLGGEIKTVELSVEAEAKKEMAEKENIEKLAAEKLSKFYENDVEDSSKKKVSIIKDVNDIDFSSIKIFVFELNKIVEKGLGEGEVKIPHYLYENMSYFFGDEKDMKHVEDDKGKERLANVATFEILDVIKDEKSMDNNVILYDTDKYFAIKSSVLNALKPDEKDIIRLIKKGDNEFCLELIRKDAKEYEIWENFCMYTMKNSKRKFGIM